MLIGRDTDVCRVTALIEASVRAQGHLHVIQLDGDIGVGKSALLSAVFTRLRSSVLARTKRVHIVMAQGASPLEETPLEAFRPLLEEALGDPLEDLLRTQTPSVLALRWLDTIGAGTLCVAVDNAAWLDEASNRFLETLMAQPQRAPLVFVATHRTAQVPTRLLATARLHGARHDHFSIQPLTPEAIAHLASELSPHQRTAVVGAANGNPLFALTAIAALRQHPETTRPSEALQVAGAHRASALSSAVAIDLEHLDDPTRLTLETFAVLGHADIEAATKITELAEGEIVSSARLLADRGLLPNGSGDPQEALHPVIRFGVYHNTDPHRRTQLHLRAAHLPDTRLFDRAEHLAGTLQHDGFFTGRRSPLTATDADILVEAASVAIGSCPRAVVRWLACIPSELRTTQSETLLARAMILVGDVDAAIMRLRVLPQETSNSQARVLLANALRIIGQTAEARAVLASAHDIIEHDNPVLLREYIDVLALIDGHAPEELVSRLEFLAETDAASSDLNRVVAATYRTMTLLSEGKVPQARVTFQRVIGWAERVTGDELSGVLHAAACAAWAAYILEHYVTGMRLASRALEIARCRGQADVLANLGTALCFCRASLGMLDDADTAGQQAVHDAERYGSPALVGVARAGLMLSAQGRNAPSLLQKRFDALMHAPVPDLGWWRRAVLTTRTRVSAMLGCPEHCPELLGEPKDAMAALRYADAASAAAALGDPYTAQTLLDEALRIADEQKQDGQHAMILATQGELLLRDGKPLEAGNLFRSAIPMFEHRGMRLQLGRAQTGIARAEAALAAHSASLSQLTGREREVAVLVAQGLKNREIAGHLSLSTSTAENHVRNVLKKLGLSARGEVTRVLAPLTSTSAYKK